MSRSQRLLDLIHLLRGYRYPVTGQVLAEKSGVSLRTLYRDIATLQSQGACIEGEAGVGYVLKPGFILPPLMFTEAELEAMMLGARWASTRTDPKLSESAHSALTKIKSVLPPDLINTIEADGLFVVPSEQVEDTHDLSVIREAMRLEKKVTIHYTDLKQQSSTRIIWPFALTYFDHVKVLVSWCELRKNYRHFRTDNIDYFEVMDDRFPRYRQVLLKEWRALHNIKP